ncbi:MAG: hypothetical protein JSR45_14040 [Proteobacteria bacterium]|nr:hypothetical protein [Pseudomonadota bacterium]
MAEVVAIHCVYRNPDGRMRATGNVDSEGNAIIVADPEIHQPGDIFTISDPDELADLVACGAVQAPDHATLRRLKILAQPDVHEDLV